MIYYCFHKTAKFLAILSALGAHSLNAKPEALAKPYNAAELQQDFDVAISVLTQAHPALYEHVSKDQLERKVEAARQLLDQPMTQLEFYRTVAPVFAAVSCYHTNVKPSLESMREFESSVPLLPLDIVVRNSAVYITRDYGSSGQIPPGLRLLAINGVTIEKIVDVLAANFPQGVDGSGIERRYARLAQPGYFGRALSVQFGLSAPYSVTIASPETGVDRTVATAGLTMEELQAQLPPRNSRPSLEFLGHDSTAIITIPSFQEQEGFEKFLSDSFRSLKKRRIENLIVDLKENGGGEDLYGALLFSYLSGASFRYYGSLEARADHFDAAKYDKDFPVEAFERRLVKVGDGKFQVRNEYHRGLQLQHPRRDHFDGKVFCLISGVTGSAATEFSAIAKSHKRAIFVGEETGGGYLMDSSGTTITAILPNTHARAIVPTVRYNLAVDRQFLHRGILPDVPSQSSVADLVTGVDRQLLTARALIESRKKTTTELPSTITSTAGYVAHP